MAVERHACSVNGCTFRATRKDNLRQHHQRLHPSIPFLQKLIARDNPKSHYSLEDRQSTDSAPASAQQSKPEVAEQSLPWASNLFFQAASAGDSAVLQAQLNSGIDINVRAADGSSALHCATRAGHSSVAKWLLQNGAYLEATNFKLRSPLHEALIGHDLKTVQLLIHEGALLDVSSITIDSLGRSESEEMLKVCLDDLADNVKSTTLYRILKAASKSGHIRTVQAVLSLFLNNVSALNGTISQNRLAAWQTRSMRPDLAAKHLENRVQAYTPLQIAAVNGHLEIVQLLVNHGSDINQAYHGMTPFCLTVLRGHVHVAEYLFDQANLSKDHADLTSHYRIWTPLHQVAHDGRCEMIEFLLDRNLFDIHVSDRFGRTPLHAAASSGRLKAVMLLLKRSNSNNTDDSTAVLTPLQLAAVGGHLEVVQPLLDHLGFDTAPFSTSEVPQQGQFEPIRVLERLLKHPDFEDINFTHHSRFDADRNGLLNAMISKKQYDCVRLLLSHGRINVNLEGGTWSGGLYTPLILAVELGQKDIVELLLQHKDIDINARTEVLYGGIYRGDYRQKTALSVARAKGHGDIVELLLAHGAKDTAPELLKT
ncbi:hypothetical protein HBH64_216390 [Parastagonospora nodorum]|nr:hypothetical protein HBI02_215740 [Parastagonospora nodorum]KAH4292181.1 hypothetical protein HBI01_184720 [Parastagonospora nodorum]KAH4323591.1 hypothetical protein HBI00_182450 [Parastagonospora nodorum]KAH4356721.1 hypothetical protein HBH94_228050 [Parastagonospora nodorum]KAH4445327.1 hypothetical protein HBH90_215960 [Parastagonospora nodorum]